MRKSVPTILLLLSTATALQAQEFEVPQNYVIRTRDDYVKYEKDIIRCFDWLMATPANKESEKRMDAGAFMMKWLSGTPYLTVDVQPKIVNFMDVNPDLLLIFVCGWTKHVLVTGDSSKVNANVKGLESVMQFYTKNREILQKDKHVEKYIKMKEAGELESFVRKSVR